MGIKRIIGMGGICTFFAVVGLLLGGGDASGQTPLTMNYSTLSMSCGGSQPLSASGGCPPYSWSLSGGGALTPSGGDYLYEAATSNTNCANNAAITLTDSCRNMVEIQLAVNCYFDNDNVAAWEQTDMQKCYCFKILNPDCAGMQYNNSYLLRHRRWNCRGDLIYEYGWWPYAECPSQQPPPCTNFCACEETDEAGCWYNYNCVSELSAWWLGNYIPCDTPLDVRSGPLAYLKTGGCCPRNPLTGLPLDDIGDLAANAGRPDKCEETPETSNRSVANPVNVATGNKYEEILDISLSTPGIPFEFRRSYNNQIKLDGPFGYGWTHTFDLRVQVVQATPPKRVIVWDSDGRALRFTERNRTSTEITFYGESGVKDRLKQQIITPPYEYGDYLLRKKKGNLTYSFESNGRLHEISDPNLNTIDLNYAEGRLSSVENNFGMILSIGYNTEGRIETITDPKGQSVYYEYQTGNLWKVNYRDAGSPGPPPVPPQIKDFVEYSYDGNHNLTEKKDTAGQVFGHWEYYDDWHRVKEYYSHQDGDPLEPQEKITLEYTPGETKVTRITGTGPHVTTYTTKVIDGIKVVEKTQGCSTCGGVEKEFDYDGLNLWKVTYVDGTQSYTTEYRYDDPPDPRDQVGEILEKTEALGKPEQRTTSYAYTHRTEDPFILSSSTETKPSVVAGCSQSKVVTTTYDTNGKGNIESRAESGCVLVNGSPTAVAYTTAYEYNSYGQLTQINGPREDVSDVTNFEYYDNDVGQGDNRGQLKAIVNALNQRTEFSEYDANGNVGRIIDPNGVNTVYTYDERNRISAVTNETAGTTTEYSYDGRGNLYSVTLPELNSIYFTYNKANKLTEIKDRLESDGPPVIRANKIIYRYDAQGNRIREEIWDTNGELKKELEFAYNEYNRLSQIKNPDQTYTEYWYDGRGNRITIKEPKDIPPTNPPTIPPSNPPTNYDEYQYDPLNRLKKMTQPGNVFTDYDYDTHDNLKTVIDPNGHTTTYVYDDFGRKNGTISPDTGTTSYEYDEAGNLVKRTDAEGTVLNYVYDALNRLTYINFPGTEEDVTFRYDTYDDPQPPDSYGIGRLTGRMDPSGSYVFHYDAHGRLKREEKTITAGGSYTTQYEYNDNGVLTKMTYPTGRTVNYDPDSVDKTRISQVLINDRSTLLASGITYLPFGGVTELIYGNNLTLAQGYDNQYRKESITVGAAGSVLNLAYGYDPNGNITSVVDTNNPGPGLDLSEAYFYQQGNNRLSQRIAGTGTIS